jgi:hypothetical protein
MYYCPIVPVPHLDDIGYCRMALVLSHLVGDGKNRYTEFYRSLAQLGTYIILDNGAYEAWLEDEPLPMLEETLGRAETVGAHEIQFLEAFWDGKGTVDVVRSWSEEMDQETRQQYAWHAIVQGKDQEDYMYCFDALAEMETVDVIGLPKIVTPRCFSRACHTDDLAITRIFAVTQLIQRTAKPFHLLGLEDPREVLIQRRWGTQIRSVDSSFPIIHAIHGIHYLPEGPDFPVNLDRFDFQARLPAHVVELARDNIAALRAWCGEPEQKCVAGG